MVKRSESTLHCVLSPGMEKVGKAGEGGGVKERRTGNCTSKIP